MDDNSYSILVNTCDKFEDCWEPFFKLFKKYWPDYKGTIYLNTEYKDYSYDGLNIVALKVCQKRQDAHKITWSECLKRALDLIDSEIVLYMQEDYFLKARVENKLVEKYAELIQKISDIHCIHLTDQSLISTEEICHYEGLKVAKMNQRYRISCQAALWKKNVLSSYIRVYESAWQFEEFGSKRGAIMKHSFYVVDEQWVILNHFEIIPYIFTGIIQGRWNDQVVNEFSRNNICIDYSKRGFTKETPERTFQVKLRSYIKKIPTIFRSKYEIIYLKILN